MCYFSFHILFPELTGSSLFRMTSATRMAEPLFVAIGALLQRVRAVRDCGTEFYEFPKRPFWRRAFDVVSSVREGREAN